MKVGDLDAAARTIVKINTEVKPLALPPDFKKPEGMDDLDKEEADDYKLAKIHLLAELATAECGERQRDRSQDLCAAVDLLRGVSADHNSRAEAEYALIFTQIRLGEIDAAIGKLFVVSGFSLSLDEDLE